MSLYIFSMVYKCYFFLFCLPGSDYHYFAYIFCTDNHHHSSLYRHLLTATFAAVLLILFFHSRRESEKSCLEVSVAALPQRAMLPLAR